MRKFSKLFAAVLLVCCVALTGAMAACSSKETEAKLTDGRWSWVRGGLSISLKLKEDNTFYMSVFTEGNETAGTWELKNESKKYYKITEGSKPADSDADKTEYTAEQTLVLTAYNGTVYTAAYADGTLWNCAFPAMGSRTLTHQKDYEWKESDEVDVQILSASLPKDSNKKIVLYHTGNFDDQTGEYAEGTWELNSTGYTLKKDGAAYGTITKLADGKCTFTPNGGAAVTLYAEVWKPSYTLSAEQKVKPAGQTEETDATFELKLWGDDSADLYYTDSAFKTVVLVSGTWEDGDGGKVKVTLGDNEAVETSAPDSKGDFTLELTVDKGTVFAEDVNVTLKGKAGAFIYGGGMTPDNNFPSYVQVSDVQLVALRDGNYSVIATAGAQGNAMAATFATGIYTEEYAFTYTDKDKKTQTAQPKLNDAGKVIVEFANVKMTGLPLPVDCIAEVITVTLGDSWNFIAANDYTVTDVTETYTASDNITVNSASLFMKDGKFQASFNVTVSSINMTMNQVAWTGTYAVNGDTVTFTVPGKDGGENTVFTSVNGKVSFTGFTVSGLGANVDMSFTVTNKTTVIASSNGDTPFQTANADKAAITAMELHMKDGEFSIKFTAMGQTNNLCTGTYTEENGGGYTFSTSYVKGDGKVKTDISFTSANGTVTFAFPEYMIMSMFSGGTVTGIFHLAA